MRATSSEGKDLHLDLVPLMQRFEALNIAKFNFRLTPFYDNAVWFVTFTCEPGRQSFEKNLAFSGRQIKGVKEHTVVF